MLCRNPYTNRQGIFGCGQCMPCRITKRRTWTHRVMLEALLHPHNAFVTLTYRSEHLRTMSGHYTAVGTDPNDLPSVHRSDVQGFLKRLRQLTLPERIRFYGCGEYGDETNRPHYHLALFNYPRCVRGRTYHRKDRFDCCTPCNRLYAAWGLGEIDVGELTAESSNYIAGYVTKKMTAKTDDRLLGRAPEFACMSLRPGIGADFMDEVASEILSLGLEESEADVPSALRHGKRLLPLGRYLTRRLRERVGKGADTPEALKAQRNLEVRILREEALKADKPVKAYIKEAADGKVASMEARQKLYRKRGTI